MKTLGDILTALCFLAAMISGLLGDTNIAVMLLSTGCFGTFVNTMERQP